jgi:hypothetical protein
MMFYLAFNWYYWFFLGAASSLLTVANMDAQRDFTPKQVDSRIVVRR